MLNSSTSTTCKYASKILLQNFVSANKDSALKNCKKKNQPCKSYITFNVALTLLNLTALTLTDPFTCQANCYITWHHIHPHYTYIDMSVADERKCSIAMQALSFEPELAVSTKTKVKHSDIFLWKEYFVSSVSAAKVSTSNLFPFQNTANHLGSGLHTYENNVIKTNNKQPPSVVQLFSLPSSRML